MMRIAAWDDLRRATAARAGVIAVIAACLAWRVLAVGAMALLEEESAPAAFDDAAAQQAFWRDRIARDPSDAYALIALAAAMESDGRHADALRAVREALRLAPADRLALFEIARFHLRTGAERDALMLLRRVADLHPEAAAAVWPLFAASLDRGTQGEFFIALAREHPAWWSYFFDFACNHAVDSDGVQALFVASVEAGGVDRAERACVLGRAQREGRWAQAHQLWITSLQEDQRKNVPYVYNGGFELPLSNIGFDWLVPRREDVRVDTQPMEGMRGARALHVTWVNKRFDGPPIYQYLMLAPGRYRFQGMGRPEGLESWLGLQWGLHCVSDAEPQQLAKSPRFLGSEDWTEFHDDFVVGTDCPLQILRLELANPRRDADAPGNVAARLRGAVSFDDLRVVEID